MFCSMETRLWDWPPGRHISSMEYWSMTWRLYSLPWSKLWVQLLAPVEMWTGDFTLRIGHHWLREVWLGFWWFLASHNQCILECYKQIIEMGQIVESSSDENCNVTAWRLSSLSCFSAQYMLFEQNTTVLAIIQKQAYDDTFSCEILHDRKFKVWEYLRLVAHKASNMRWDTKYLAKFYICICFQWVSSQFLLSMAMTKCLKNPHAKSHS